MENLAIEENEFLRLERTSLPVASYCKFQPLTVDFMDIQNPKVVLERALRGFACLTAGDLIAIRYNDRRYELNVMETKPEDAVCIIECDMRVEFAAPVGYVEPSAAAAAGETVSQADKDVEAQATAPLFPSDGMRIDGKPVPPSLRVRARRPQDPDYSYTCGSLRFTRKASAKAGRQDR